MGFDSKGFMDSTRQALSSAKENCSCGMETAIRKDIHSSSAVACAQNFQGHFLGHFNFVLAQIFITIYKWVLGPALHALGGANLGCRYPQSCSEFAYQSLLHQGPIKGTFLALCRLLSCNPWMAPRPKLMFAPSSKTDEEWNS
jgi:putative component of membrane protein insertase Oxa1/YidC/SpoIIIJ protein YidD